MPLTLGAVAAALVAEAADTSTEEGFGDEMLDRLIGWLRRLFAADESNGGAAALSRMERDPDGPSTLVELAYVLNRRAEADADFRADLMALVQEASAAGIDVGAVTRTAWGIRSMDR